MSADGVVLDFITTSPTIAVQALPPLGDWILRGYGPSFIRCR